MTKRSEIALGTASLAGAWPAPSSPASRAPDPMSFVVAYFAQNRPRGMCDESYSTSTWFLDEAERPVAAVLTNEPDTGPAAVAVRRSEEIHVRAPGGCEARIAWSELREAALREAEQRASSGPPR